jgi:hypothetical protein
MSVRSGFFAGFLGASVIAALLAKRKSRKAVNQSVDAAPDEGKGAIADLRRAAREAIDAGRVAAREREQELRQEYEATIRSQS